VFFEQLIEAQRATRGRLCVGLDPQSGTADDVRATVRRVIGETAEHACAYKPNAAFFEALGPRGAEVLAETIEWIHAAERPALLDAKRGDIASTAEAYARAAFDVLGADAITVVPYMGEDAVRPFLDRGGTVFIVALPSNRSAARIVEHGTPPLFLRVAELASEWARECPGRVGLVVGATRPDLARRIHESAPDLLWLVPGLGAQGGDVKAFEQAARHNLVLYSVSRGVFADPSPGEAARRWKEEIGGGPR
jgi:orotidine 5'-phosphate decarboxylase subfamily 2